MKILPTLLVVAALGLAGAGTAHADHGHGHGHTRFGVVIGAPVIGPYWGPYAYPPYPYYYPPVVVERPVPQVYVEQQPVAAPPAAAAPAPAENYWYYCAESKTYYPYVKECAGPWQRVTPQPPPSAPR